MKINEILLEFNISNQDSINDFLEKSLKDKNISDPKKSNWFLKKARDYILKNKENFKLTDNIPQNPPLYLQKALEKGEDILEFSPTNSLKEEILFVLDWLSPLDTSHEDYLKLDRISFVDALKRHEEMGKVGKKKQKIAQEEMGDYKEIYKFSNGYKIVELLDDVCKTREGNLMGHCVGGYKDEVIYSLWDNKNIPHATMEIGGKKIVQLQGKGNKDIIEEYVDYILEFIREEGYELEDRYWEKLGYIKLNDEWYDIKKPEEFPEEVMGSVRIDNENVKSLGNIKYIHGSLTMSYQKITSLGNLEYVGGYLNSMDTEITSLGNLKHVGDHLYLTGTKVTSLGKLKYVGGYLDLRNTKITELPENLEIHDGNIYFSKSQEGKVKIPKHLKDKVEWK